MGQNEKNGKWKNQNSKCKTKGTKKTFQGGNKKMMRKSNTAGNRNSFFKKALVGAKKGAKEIEKFSRTYGPRINRGLGSVAESIQSGLIGQRQYEQRQMRGYPYMKISKSGKRRMVIVEEVPRRRQMRMF